MKHHSRATKRRQNLRHLYQAISRGLEPLESRTLLTGDVLATVIHDANNNGVANAGEPRLSGWTIYVDFDRNGAFDSGEPSAVTNGAGQAFITGIPDNTWDVREIVPSGYAPADGFDDFERIRVRDGETVNVSFLNVSTSGAGGTIQGTVWNDVDQDGVRDPSDPGIPGWTIFLDLNTDGFLNAGEPSTITDANGAYSFTGLAPGRYRVREITPSGWDTAVGTDGGANVDVAAGQTRVADFGNINTAGFGTIRGSVWNDVNADGFRAAGDPGLSNWTVFLDLDTDGIADPGEPSTLTDTAGVYTFEGVTVGAARVSTVLKDDWHFSPSRPGAITVSVNHEDPATADFAVFTPTLGSISGRLWNDADGNGAIGASEAPLVGWTVFIDQNADGVANAGEPAAVSDFAGMYTISDAPIGSTVVREVPAVGWSPTAPGTGMQQVTVPNGTNVSGINFGNKQRTDGAISGIVFADANQNGVRDLGEKGLPGIAVYLDLNNDGVKDPSEPSMNSSADLFYTPAANEAGTYQFTHLAGGVYHVREVVPDLLSATPAAAREQTIDLAVGEDRKNVDFADVYRASEIHGVVFDDVNKNHVRDAGEAGIPGVTVYLDTNRNDIADADEPRTVTDADGAYGFVTNLKPGSYVVRALHHSGREHTYPETTGGTLWPAGVSHPTIGNVTPTSITTSLAKDQTEQHTVSLTLPGTGALTNMVDVFLLFDDTGSFTANSPIVRAAFPQIISTLQAGMPGVDFGFGVGRFEEYANFASEFSNGRPFILNQPIVAASTSGFAAAIQSALDRTAPGYGGDTPETDVEALYQMATGAGFDGNNNGTTIDSGAAGLVSTQLTPGASGDVPSFASFTVDPSGNVLPASGSIGGAGFRPGALPIILTATDTGFAFQPMGETSITGINGLTLPVSAFTQTSRTTTPFNSGAGIQQTITALNALGALVIGLGTNGVSSTDPRQGLEAFAKLTGAVNRSAATIDNGTLDTIAPGDPLYFQISSGFGASVANGIVTAIQNAVSNVDVNLTLKASDPRVKISSTPGVIDNVGASETATFDVTFTGDGRPHRFDLRFVREGTDVMLGSIPVLIGTPIVGDGYEYVELEDGEIHHSDDFGDSYNPDLPVNVAPSFVKGADQSVAQGAGVQTIPGWATSISAGPANEAGQLVEFLVSSDNGGLFSAQPTVAADGTLAFTPTAGASGSTSVTIRAHDSGGSVGGGEDTSAAQTFTITITGPSGITLPGTSGDDVYELRIEGGDLAIYKGAGPAATRIQTVAPGGAGAGAISFDGGDGNDSLTLIGDMGAEAATVNASAISFAGANIVYSGVEKIAFNGHGGWDTLNVTGGAAVVLPATQQLESLNVDATSRVAVPAKGDITIMTRGLTLAGRLDLADNDLIVDYSGASAIGTTYGGIADLLESGYDFGAWDGPSGIVTTMSDATGGLTTLGISEAADVTGLGSGETALWSGQTIDATTVIVKYTYAGDANLDGIIDGGDYGVIDNFVQVPGADGFANGDFNYDGAIDGGDYGVIDNNIQAQGAAL